MDGLVVGLVTATAVVGFMNDLNWLVFRRRLNLRPRRRGAGPQLDSQGRCLHRWQPWKIGADTFTGMQYVVENGRESRLYDDHYRTDHRLCHDCPKVQYRRVDL